MSASRSEPLPVSDAPAPRGPRAWWRRPLTREIVLLLVCKLILLMVLRALFFSHPAAPHMRLPSDTVARALLGSPTARPAAATDPMTDATPAAGAATTRRQ